MAREIRILKNNILTEDELNIYKKYIPISFIKNKVKFVKIVIDNNEENYYTYPILKLSPNVTYYFKVLENITDNVLDVLKLSKDYKNEHKLNKTDKPYLNINILVGLFVLFYKKNKGNLLLGTRLNDISNDLHKLDYIIGG